MSPNEDEDLDVDIGGPPDAPTNVEISGFEATSVNLKWKAPAKDGGIAIKEYFIEFKKPGDEEWSEGPKLKPSKFLTGQVGELTTNTKYEFRVSAINRAGQGKPSDPTAPLLVKALNAPPKIDRAVLGESQSVKVNQQLVLEIPVDGAPAPETSWWKDDAELKSTDVVRVAHSANCAKLMFIPARRNLAGKYILKAKNKHGEDSTEVQIDVFGKPTTPSGLQISDVNKRGCLLSWKPPSDNGGYQISHYEVEKSEVGSEQWLPIKTTKGLSLQVSNLVEGRSYNFLVRAVNDLGDSPDLVTEEPIIAKNPFDPPGQPSKPDVVDWGENFAELRWKEGDGSEATSYKVEMRNRSKRAWICVGTTKETSFRVADNIAPENEYEFRVTASNQGGDSECSASSKSILAETRFVKPRMNRDLLGTDKTVHVGQPLRLAVEIVATPKPTVTFTLPNGADAATDARCTVEVEDNLATLTVLNVTRADRGNIHIAAKNSQGLDEAEIRIDVIGPPSKPIGPLNISGVHPHGCTLSWKKPLDDGGSPLTSYIIEKKDLDKDIWISCGKSVGKTVVVMKEVDFEVTGLMEYQVYMFRVLAANAQGEGEPLESQVPVMAKHAIDPPAMPSTPRIVDFDRKSAKLEWWAPAESNIKHYIVEMQERFLVPKDSEEEGQKSRDDEAEGEEGHEVVASAEKKAGPSFNGEFQEYLSNWMTATITDENEPKVHVTGLDENHKYCFRIKAVNAAGASDPSEPTDEIVCKLRKQMPRIARDSLKDVKVSAGQTIKLSAKVAGEPEPVKAWYYGKIEIKACPSVDITETEYSIKVTMMNARRDDTGIYTLRIENEHGSDSADVSVIVTVPPSKPHGPMKIYDVYAEGCTCEWSAPLDDGDSPITHYLIEKLEGKQTQWIACGRTNGNTTVCHIVGLTTDKEHRLRVIAVNAEGESEPLAGVDSFRTENPYGPPSAPSKPWMVDVDVDHFDMKWEAPKNDGGSRVTGYQLESRLWKDSIWFKSGEVRHQLEFGEASGIELGKAYTIRVRAVNAAGPGPWSIESDQIVCRHKALKPKVTFRGPREVTLRAGEALSLAVDIQGEPPAEDIVWSQSSQKVFTESPGNGVYIDNSKPYMSFLEKEMVTRNQNQPKSKGARTCSVDLGRISCEDSTDTPDRPVPEITEPKKISHLGLKKAVIILPILSKHHKEAMLRAAAAKEEKEKTTVPAQLSNRPPPVIRPATPEAVTKKKVNTKSRKASASQTRGLDSDDLTAVQAVESIKIKSRENDPDFVRLVSLPSVKQVPTRLDQTAVHKSTLDQNSPEVLESVVPKIPISVTKQISLMAFLKKKKDEAMATRIMSGLSIYPGSSSVEEEEVSKPSIAKKMKSDLPINKSEIVIEAPEKEESSRKIEAPVKVESKLDTKLIKLSKKIDLPKKIDIKKVETQEKVEAVSVAKTEKATEIDETKDRQTKNTIKDRQIVNELDSEVQNVEKASTECDKIPTITELKIENISEPAESEVESKELSNTLVQDPKPSTLTKPCLENFDKQLLKNFRKQKKYKKDEPVLPEQVKPNSKISSEPANLDDVLTMAGQTKTGEEFENMGYISGDDSTTYKDEKYPKKFNPATAKSAVIKIADDSKLSVNLPATVAEPLTAALVTAAHVTAALSETPAKAAKEIENVTVVDKEVEEVAVSHLQQQEEDSVKQLHHEQPLQQHEQSIVHAIKEDAIISADVEKHATKQVQQQNKMSSPVVHDNEASQPTCDLENEPRHLQQQQHRSTTESSSNLSPSVGVHILDSAASSVQSMQGGHRSKDEMSHSNVLESPNSISSLVAVSVPPQQQQQQQQQQQKQQQQPVQHQQQTPRLSTPYLESLLSQQQPIKQSLIPPPFVAYGSIGQQQMPAEHSLRQSQQSIPSASTQGNMTSPHPQQSTLPSTQPMTISTAVLVPQPSPHGPPTSQQQGQMAKQTSQSPATHHQQQQQQQAAANQMQQLQQFQRNLWTNYGAAAMGMSQQAAAAYQFNRHAAAVADANFQAGAGMFTPPNVGFQTHSKEAAVSTSAGQNPFPHVNHYGGINFEQVDSFYGQMPNHQHQTPVLPGIQNRTDGASAGCLAKLQQLTNGVESAGGGNSPASSTSSPIPTSDQINSSTASKSSRPVSSKQAARNAATTEQAARNAAEQAARNKATVIPSGYAYPTSHQGSSGPPPLSHTPGVGNTSSVMGGYYSQADMSRGPTAGHDVSANPQISADHLMQHYGQNAHAHMLNYTGYGFMNQFMYHAAATSDHQIMSSANPQSGSHTPHPQQMYPGYPHLGYPTNYHR